MAGTLNIGYFFQNLYSDPVSIGGVLVFYLMVSGFFWGMALQKMVKGLEKVDCTILGVFTIIALFQLHIFWSVKSGADPLKAYSFLKTLIYAGPVVCIAVCIWKKSLPVPTWKHLFSFLAGFTVSVFLIHLSKRLTTNNLYFDTVSYLSQVIESVNADHFGGMIYAKGYPLSHIDVLHDLTGYYYFWAMLMKYVTLTAKFTYTGQLISIYIWGATFLYGMSLGSLIINSANVVYKNMKWRGVLFLVMIMAPYYVNYWNTTLAFFGNTIRTVCVGYSALIVYLYFSKKNCRQLFLPLGITYLASICFTSTGLFLSAMICVGIFITMCWKKNNDWRDYAGFIGSCFPVFCYGVLIILTEVSVISAIVASVLMCVILCFIAWLLRGRLLQFDKICGFLLPAAFIVLAALSFMYRNSDYGYAFFFASRSLNDMTVNMTSHLDSLEMIRNVIFYALLIMCVFTGNKTKWFRFFLMILVVLFINPLVQPAVSNLLTSNVYSRSFDLLMNPFTLCFMICNAEKLLHALSWAVLPAAGLVSLFISANTIQGERNNSLLDAERVENYQWEEKAPADSLEMYEYIAENIANSEKRPFILSQEVGLKGYVPDISIIFTTTDYRDELAKAERDTMAGYITTILNPNRRFGTEDTGLDEKADFTKLSLILTQYEPDYLVISQTMSQWDDRGWYNNVYTNVVNSGQGELLWNNNSWAVLKINKYWKKPNKNNNRYWVHRIGSEYTAETEN